MNTREYQNYKRMTKMTVRFLEKDGTITDSKTKIETPTRTTLTTTTAATMTSRATRATTPTALLADSLLLKTTRAATPANIEAQLTQQPQKKETTPAPEIKHNKTSTDDTRNDDSLRDIKIQIIAQKSQKPSNGRYVNWSSKHSTLASLPWCCIGDLMAFCDKYEYRSLSRNDPQLPNRIITEVKTLLGGAAPFDVRKRFPSNIHSPENLWVCIGRCASVEYHLNRIMSLFRKPLDKLSADKQRMVRHDFHLAINELRLDISARISEVRLYDQHVFEKEFRFEWQDEPLAE